MIMTGYTCYMTDFDTTYTNLGVCTRFFEYWQLQTRLLDALEKNNQSLLLTQRMVRYLLEEEPEYAHYMGISPSDVMEHVVYTVSGTMGMILVWHHERYPKTAAQMGLILYQLMRHQANKGEDLI